MGVRGEMARLGPSSALAVPSSCDNGAVQVVGDGLPTAAVCEEQRDRGPSGAEREEGARPCGLLAGVGMELLTERAAMARNLPCKAGKRWTQHHRNAANTSE